MPLTATMESAQERFFDKVEKTDGCWIWKACKNKDGYGKFRYQKDAIKSHRFSYCLHNICSLESISEFVIRHSCHNPSCVNPDHLSTGTNQDNVNDMIAAGRQVILRGEAHGRCKLTDEQVRAIRVAEGLHKDIAVRFGVSRHHICCIKSGKYRADVI